MLTVVLFNKKGKVAYATDSWNDSLNLFPNATAKHESAHLWVNNLTNVYQDVYLELVTVENISVLKFYLIHANGTYFINITDSEIVVSNYTYYNLRENECLSFDIFAKPNMNGMCSVIVTVKVFNILIGDINRNDWVNIYDGILLGNSWGMNSNQTGWDVKKDLNKDNVINIYDGILLGNHFGEKF